MPRLYDRIAGRSLERLAALSDGVFAVAMTLLVLDLRTPTSAMVHDERGLLAALVTLSPRLVTYLMSFLTLGIFWLGQQTQFNSIERSDRDFAWIHIGFLATVCLLPFSTTLLAEFITFRAALLVYWFNIFLLGVLLLSSWLIARWRRLVKDGEDANLDKAVIRRILGAQTLYAIAAALCVFSNYWSIALIVAIQLNYAIAPHFRPFETRRE